MRDFYEPASDEELQQACQALEQNGMRASIGDSGEYAKRLVLELIPEGAEVFTMTSVTLDAIGLAAEINESGRYDSVRAKLNALDPETQKREKRRLGAAPEWAIGSAHAVTQDGHLLIASNTGSQLAAEVYGAEHVVFVVGAQKIVANDQQGMQRIYEHTLPLERERAKKAYGIHSNVSKLLIINKEVMPDRITVILVKEKVGF